MASAVTNSSATLWILDRKYSEDVSSILEANGITIHSEFPVMLKRNLRDYVTACK